MIEALPERLLSQTPLPANEAGRLETLRRYNILDTPPEVAFDRITALAARLFEMPIALVSLIDESRGWFKSAHGFGLQEVQRDAALCSLTLLSNEVLVIPDTRQDDRLAHNPLVQSEPGLRFYAGAPLLTQDGFNLGTLCLLDMKPRQALTDEQKATLSDLAAVVVDELELRSAAHRISQIDAALLEVTQGVSGLTGEAFFRALVQHLTKVLNIDYVCITGLVGADQAAVNTIAFCAQGQIVDNIEYFLQDTPCLEVIRQQKLCCYPQGVQAQFPHDTFLASSNIESYAAIPFFDSTGKLLGLLSVMDSKPLASIQLVEALLTIFALRIATELERQKTEAKRQQAQHELERLVEQRTAELSQANNLLHLEIAERQQAEVTLQKEQEMLKVLLDNVQAGIVACDADGILTLFNQAAREFHGLPEQPLPPDQWGERYDLYKPDGKTRMPKDEIPLFRALQGETIDNVEMVIAPKQGNVRTLIASGQAIRAKGNSKGTVAQGKHQGAVVVMHDITERKRAEEERAQLMREQSARAAAEQSQQQAAFLAEVSSMLASSLEYEQTLQSMTNLVVPYFADWCSIDLLNDDCSISRVAVRHSDPEKVKLGWEVAQRYPRHLSDGYGISKVMQAGQSEIAPEITEEQLVTAIPNPEYLQIVQELGLKSCIMAPLKARGRVLGTISFVFSESDRHYKSTDLDLAEDLARRSAIALDNARLYHSAQQAKQVAETAADRTARLQTVTAALSESLTPEQVADVIVEQSMAALEATAALVVLVSKDRTELEIVKSIGYQTDLVESWQKFSIDTDVPLAEAIRTGEPVWAETLLDRIARRPDLAHVYRRYGFDSWIALPLVIQGRSVGGMLLSFKEFKHLNQDDRDFILALSRQCAQAISRAQLYEAERVARGEAEQANRVKDEFLSVLSHELRTPLNPILGWSKLLQNQKHDPAILTRGLQTIERNAKLQTQLIEDLLDVSRILQGKLRLSVTSVDLKATIEAAAETVRLAAEAKAIQIQTRLNPDVGYVSGDAGRLQQVVWNLLSNAIKFTPEGGQAQISLEQVDGQAQIQISDTGQGITPEFVPYIFDRFRQADSKTTRKFGGLGLGLAIVRQLVELHGGTVHVDSAGEGQGTTFTVRLPLIKDQVREKEDEREGLYPSTSIPHLLHGIRVLVVDDEIDARELLVFILEQSGAIVTSAPSAVEALQALTHLEIDVLISDIGMPEVNGYRLMQQIRAMPSQQGGAILAVALTAYAGETDRQQALAAGFHQHMTKPVEPDKVVKLIADLIEDKRHGVDGSKPRN